MKKIIRFTESELINVVKRIIKEQYFDELTKTSSSSGSNVVQNFENEMNDYRNKMDSFLSELKSSGTVDWNRFLKQVRNQTNDIFNKHDVDDLTREDSLNLFKTFSRLQLDFLNHFKEEYKNSKSV